jgi:tripartite-type tricarboxylate transporter receptor subunit TctC
MFDNLGNSLPFIREERVKALSVVAESPISELPGVPAVAQTYPRFLAQSWFGVVAPPGTPTDLAEKISLAIADTVRAPEVKKRLQELSFTAVGSSPAQMKAFTAREIERWRQVIEANGMKPE